MKIESRVSFLIKYLRPLFLSFALLFSFFSCSDNDSKDLNKTSSSSSSSEKYHFTNETISKLLEGTLYIDEKNGVEKNTAQHYSISSRVETILFRYKGEISYSPLSFVFKRAGTVIKSGSFSSKTFCEVDIKGIPLGTYSITFYGDYKGYTYSYPITLVIEDADN